MAHAEGHDRIDTVPGACKAAHRSDCQLHVAEEGGSRTGPSVGRTDGESRCVMALRDAATTLPAAWTIGRRRFWTGVVATGLQARFSSGLGYRVIDGMDASGHMLAQARARGAYRRLFSARSPAELPDRSYDAVVAARVLRGDDASPGALDDLVRLLRAGGVISLAVAPEGVLADACERMCRQEHC